LLSVLVRQTGKEIVVNLRHTSLELKNTVGTLGVAVSGATDGNERLTECRDGTSTAAPVAAALPHFSLSILGIYLERRIWMVPFTITCASYFWQCLPSRASLIVTLLPSQFSSLKMNPDAGNQ